MKKETTPKNKKWILPVSIAAAVLVIVGVVLAIFLGPWQSKDSGPAQSKLYWNVDRQAYLDIETGMSIREPGADGLFSIRFAVDGQQVEYKCADKRLVNSIDFMSVMGLAFDADGLIIEALDPATVATKIAEEYFIRSFDGNTLVLNSSMAMNGMALTLTVNENTNIYDVTAGAQVVGAPGNVDVMDMVTVYGNEAGEPTHVYRLSAAVQAEVYHRLVRMYDNANKKTTRVPDENGVYTIDFAHKGQQVSLKCRDVELVTGIDSAYDAGCQMGLIFDDEGYIIDRVSAAEAIKGQLLYKKMSVTGIDGNLISVESRYYSNTDLGTTDTLILPEDCEMYLLEADCEAHFIGEATDHLKVGDRCYIYADLDGNPKMIFIERRMVDSKLYYNVTRMYDSVALETTRVPDSKGYYVFTMAVDGKQVELKTKDKALATKADSMSTMTMGLKLNGSIIEEVYGCNCATGLGVNSNRFVTEIMGGIVRIVNRSDWTSGGNYLLAPDCQIYDVTANCNVPIGSVTELQPYDWIASLYLNENNQITHMYIQQRYIEDGKLVYHLNQQYNSEKQETARIPNEEGYYVFEMLSEGKKITMKTKDKAVASYIDRQKYPVTVRLSGEIIKGAYSAGSCLKGGTTLRGQRFQKLLPDGSYEYINTTTEVLAQGRVIAKDCTVYNYAPVCEKYRGEKTTLRKGDMIYAVYSREDNEIHKMFVYSGRESDSPLYFNRNRMYNFTKLETTREPDADGWYVYELAADGKLITAKTKDRALATEIDKKSSGFGLTLDGDVITQVFTYPYIKDLDTIVGSHFVVTKIDGKTLTLEDPKPYSTTLGQKLQVQMRKDCEVFNVSSYAEKFGAAATLEVGDRVQVYVDAEGNARYCLIMNENTRKAGAISYCAHCDKEVYWEPFTGAVTKNDLHCYLPVDMSTNQLQVGYSASQMESVPTRKQYEMILDLNGHTLTGATRGFLVYGTLTIMDSVGTGVVQGGTSSALKISTGGTFNLYGGTLKAGENAESINYGGTLDGSRCTVNIYGGTVTGGEAVTVDKDGEPNRGRGGTIYLNLAELNIYGGTIEAGTVDGSGGTIYALDTKFNMTGGTILGGTATGTGGAVYLNKSSTGSTMNMSGGTIKGGVDGGNGDCVYVNGSVLNMTGGTIEGELYFSTTSTVTLSGKPVVSDKLVVPAGGKLTLGELTEGASIDVYANGVFTVENEKAKNYMGYFHPVDPLDVIGLTQDEKALNYIRYTSTLAPHPATDAIAAGEAIVCPTCGEIPASEWKAISTAALGSGGPGEGHYYLSENISNASRKAAWTIADKTCIHLNGYDVTGESTLSGATTFVVTGELTVMGSGTVTCTTPGSYSINNTGAVAVKGGKAHLYGGTYVAASSNNHAALHCTQSGILNIHSGVSVTQGAVVERNGGFINIDGGSFAQIRNVENAANVVVTGGTFRSDPSAYVADGYAAVDNGNGTWTVSQGQGQGPEQTVFDPAGTVCEHCGGALKVWTEIEGGSAAITLTEGGHYYLSGGLSGATGTSGSAGILNITSDIDVCLYAGSYQIKNSRSTATNNGCAIRVTGGGTLNYMGTGLISGYATSSNAAALHVDNGTVNLYGGTLENRNPGDGNKTADDFYVVRVGANGGTVTMHEGVETADKIFLYGTADDTTKVAALNITGGTYTNPAGIVPYEYERGGNTAVSVTGGTFSFDPSAYVDQQAYDVTESEGVYTVAQKNP